MTFIGTLLVDGPTAEFKGQLVAEANSRATPLVVGPAPATVCCGA